MKARIYYIPDHWNSRCGCNIPGGWKAEISGYRRKHYELPIPDQFYGSTEEEAREALAREFPGIKIIK